MLSEVTFAHLFPSPLSGLCSFLSCHTASSLTTLKQTRGGKSIQKVLTICFSCQQWQRHSLTARCYADLQLQFSLSLSTCTCYLLLPCLPPQVRQARQMPMPIPRAPSATTNLNSSQFPSQASLVYFLHIWLPLSLGRPRLVLIPQEK